MNIHEIKNLPADELENLLTGESVGREQMAYMRPLSDDQLAVKKDQLATNAILRSVIEEELRQIKDQFKEKLKPINEAITESLRCIKTRGEDVTSEVFKMPDHASMMMHMVDSEGNVISSRRMLPEEKQTRISMSIAKESNG